jgi:heat-inducible transcriptional repressor
MLTPRQELILRKVVEAHAATGEPVGSKTLASDPELEFSPSTIRNELAVLEEHGLLAHPHTSAGRVPTDAGHRWYVDHLRETGLLAIREHSLGLQLVRREIDEAMRVTSETLSQVTNMLAIVSAPPLTTATIRHVEVLLLQPQVLMVVVITSTGGVTKRVITFDRPLDPGLVQWAGEFLGERLSGASLGARTLTSRLHDPALSVAEREFIDQLAIVFTDLEAGADDTLYVEGAARLVGEQRVQDLVQLGDILRMLEHRAALLAALRSAVGDQELTVRIGSENALPELQSLALVAARYGLPRRDLGMVSVIGPVRMDYGRAIGSVRDAASELSRFLDDLYSA